ncbi:MAG: glycoside hydrolase family 88 protein [Terriglobia bacterium]
MHTAHRSRILLSSVVLVCLLHTTTLLAARITVSKVSPNSGSTTGGTAVTITGTNFASGATVTFGGTTATHVVVVNSTTITATTPAKSAGAVTVTVTVRGQSGYLARGFTYVATPTVSKVSPNSGSTTGGTAVTITGTNFASGATVTFGGTAATHVVVMNSTTITATTPTKSAGAVTVTVTVSSQSGSLANGFTYTAIVTVATPTFNPGADTYSSAQSVSITSTTSGATICYTTNGSTPAANTPGTCSTGTALANGGSVMVSTSETLEAIGTENGFTNSAVGSATYTISPCVQNLAIGNFTLCGESYNDVSTGTNVTINYRPSPGNGIIAWATWCFTSSCNTSIAGVTATIGDNINAKESCFVASPHSPFITDANGGSQGSGDFQQHYVWYCPSVPAGVTSFTVTPSNSTLSYVQLNITEWRSGSLAASCSPISACFENVDNFGQAGNSTGGTTATITTSGSTVNTNDLIFAVTEVPCCSFTAGPGTGYTGITVAPSVTPGMVSEAEAATATGIQTATTTWTGGSIPWFGVIVPIIGAGDDPVAPTVSSLSPNSGPIGTAVTITGTNFGAAQGAVSFNGTAALVTRWSASSILVAVPTGATSGNIVVKAGGVRTNGVNFTVLPSALPTATQVVTAIENVNNYWIANNAPGNADWTEATYFTGDLAAYDATGQSNYLTFAQTWATNNSYSLSGSACGEGPGENTTNYPNCQAAGQVYIRWYQLSNQSSDLSGIPERGMVNSTVDKEWAWIDAINMSAPNSAELGSIDKTMYALYYSTKYTSGLYDSTTGLWWENSTYVNTSTYWSRGNGWVFAALAKILSVLPKSDPHYQEYFSTFTTMARALAAHQQPGGYWNSDLGGTDYAGPESSGTSFFLYGFAWGLNNGILDQNTYLPVVQNAWNFLANTAIQTSPPGLLGYVQPPDGAPGPTTATTTEDFGVGAFLLAARQMQLLVQ